MCDRGGALQLLRTTNAPNRPSVRSSCPYREVAGRGTCELHTGPVRYERSPLSRGGSLVGTEVDSLRRNPDLI